MCSIEDLPNEIIYRIFDNIDTNSIISFSLTSKKFSNYIDNYNNYKINFESISKIKFDSICRLINPLNIIKLKLNDNDKTPGQIKFFIKNFQINKLNRLKSLKLIQINENDLENILKYFSNSSLNSLQIEYRKYFTLLNSSTLLILNKILSIETLKKVNLDMRSYQTDYIQWPSSSHIQYLTLFNLNLNQFIQIIQKSNQFQSIILRNFEMKDSNEIFLKLIFLKELKSFQIEQSQLFMDKIQSLISCMNQLVYLKLEGFTNIIEKFFEFENLFEKKLINLKKFQFFIRFSPNELIRNNSLIDSFIQQFKKSYWTSNLNCFVNCNFVKNSNEIHFYSIPSINHYFKYSDQLNFILFSTLSSPNNQNQTFDYVHHLDLNLTDLQIPSTQIKNCGEDNRLFPKLHYLKLTISDQCSLNCFESLSKLIHLKDLVKIVIIICSRGSYLNLMIKNFLIFLKDLSNVNSIEIFNRWHGIFSFININYFCSMIPINIKHLDVDISDINDIKILIEQLQHLTSFKFKFSFDKSLYIKDILEWLSNKRINSTYISDIHYLSIWISQQFNQTHSNKRIKLSN